MKDMPRDYARVGQLLRSQMVTSLSVPHRDTQTLTSRVGRINDTQTDGSILTLGSIWNPCVISQADFLCLYMSTRVLAGNTQQHSGCYCCCLWTGLSYLLFLVCVFCFILNLSFVERFCYVVQVPPVSASCVLRGRVGTTVPSLILFYFVLLPIGLENISFFHLHLTFSLGLVKSNIF